MLTSLVVPAKRQTPCVKRGESGPKRALNVPPIPGAYRSEAAAYGGCHRSCPDTGIFELLVGQAMSLIATWCFRAYHG